jgi:hypothetical protein
MKLREKLAIVVVSILLSFAGFSLIVSSSFLEVMKRG